MATSNDLKNGMVLSMDNQLWTVIEFQHVKPGKGPAFVRTKLKNVISGKVIDRTALSQTRMESCKKCSHMTHCNTCEICGCFLHIKTKFIAACCPLGTW
jgi:hypothetical protein